MTVAPHKRAPLRKRHREIGEAMRRGNITKAVQLLETAPLVYQAAVALITWHRALCAGKHG